MTPGWRGKFRRLWWIVVPALLVPGLCCLGTVIGVARGDLWLFPGTRSYRAVSPREDAVLRRAQRNVFPADVRTDPSRYAQSIVAWPGLIAHADIDHEGDHLRMRFELEHRYFD